VVRGEHVANIHGCTHCLGEGLSGKVFLDIPPGRFVASNLTSGQGGVGNAYAGSDWDRAVRFGLRHDRRKLLPMMPSRIYAKLADSDAVALSAYLDQLPPVDTCCRRVSCAGSCRCSPTPCAKGIATGGRELSNWMPSRDYLQHLDDTEIAALHAHVLELPRGDPAALVIR